MFVKGNHLQQVSTIAKVISKNHKETKFFLCKHFKFYNIHILTCTIKPVFFCIGSEIRLVTWKLRLLREATVLFRNCFLKTRRIQSNAYVSNSNLAITQNYFFIQIVPFYWIIAWHIAYLESHSFVISWPD